MQNNPDGSVTLSKEEFEELKKVYLAVRQHAFRAGFHVSDEEYSLSLKWKKLLSGDDLGGQEEREL